MLIKYSFFFSFFFFLSNGRYQVLINSLIRTQQKEDPNSTGNCMLLDDSPILEVSMTEEHDPLDQITLLCLVPN
jgi:hypothetical protein